MKYFLLEVRNQLSVFCGPRDGGRYDCSVACGVCGTGARRLDPIRLPTGNLKDYLACTLKFEMVIPPRLMPALRAVAPNCLREIVTSEERTPSGFFELIGETVLPPFSPATTGFATEGQCGVCRRDGYFNVGREPLQLVYDQPVPTCAVAETYERFGNSRLTPEFSQSFLASPYLVVSEPVRDVLKGERGVEFVPVRY